MSFQKMFDEVMAGAAHFGHRQHVHLTWLAVRDHGVEEAIAVVSEGIRQTARYAGAPQKYHATVSRAWVEAVGYHVAEHPVDDFDSFAKANPALLDKRLLSRFYSSALLASAEARTGWAEPDRGPFPWMAATAKTSVPPRRKTIATGPDSADAADLARRAPNSPTRTRDSSAPS